MLYRIDRATRGQVALIELKRHQGYLLGKVYAPLLKELHAKSAIRVEVRTRIDYSSRERR